MKTISKPSSVRDLKKELLDWVNRKTYRETLECHSTAFIAKQFGLKTNVAYDILLSLSKEGLIEHLEPVNGAKFDCCDWIRVSDEQLKSKFDLAQMSYQQLAKMYGVGFVGKSKETLINELTK